MNLNLDSHNHILVCPLDWGLGHSTRCIPLIDQFLRLGKQVSIAGNGGSLELLKLEFPDLIFFELPAYNISYPKKGKYFLWHMGFQSKKILQAILREKKEVERILENSSIDLILSDNRFGCYHKDIYSVFLSHQVNMSLPQGFNWLNRINKQFISRFNELWIPDFEGPDNLTGELSNAEGMDAKYIGPLSRFKRCEKSTNMTYDLLCILSGPEPQRSIFEAAVRRKMLSSKLKCALLRGVPNEPSKSKFENIDIWGHLRGTDLNDLINQSKWVLCRAGYSSIMDLYQLQKEAILVPTPGQTEQEYLARYLDGRKGFTFINQDELERFVFEDELRNVFAN
ncbi:MAG: glycosyltransferase [Bacteroidota bacterium]